MYPRNQHSSRSGLRFVGGLFAVVAILGFAVIHGAAVAYGTQADPEVVTTDLPDIPSKHFLQFPEGAWVQTVGIHPTEDRAFVLLDIPLINVWAILIFYWPGILGSIVGLVDLILLVVLIRVIRKPREMGHRYCRKCNYCLSGHDAAMVPGKTPSPIRCPECGTDCAKRKPRPGRPLYRRLAMPLALIVLSTGAYLFMLTLSIPRKGPVAGWFFWPSNLLAQLEIGRDLGWGGKWHRSSRAKIVEIDLETGQILRTVVKCEGGWAMDLSPDGQEILLSCGGGLFRRFSTLDGTELTPSPIGSPDNQFIGNSPSVLGFKEDGGAVFLAHWDDERCEAYVSEVDLASGATRRLVTVPGTELEFGGDSDSISGSEPDPPYGFKFDFGFESHVFTETYSREIRYIPNSDGRFFVSTSDLVVAYENEVYTFSIHDAEIDRVESLELWDQVDVDRRPGLSPDGTVVYYYTTDRRGVVPIDLKAMQLMEPLRLVRPHFQWRFSIQCSDQYLFVPSFPQGCEVFDLKRQESVARLMAQPSQRGVELPERHGLNGLANRGRWLLAPTYGSLANGDMYQDLLIWDLNDIPESDKATEEGSP